MGFHLLVALVLCTSPSYAQQRNAILHWRNGDSLPGNFLEGQGDRIRWKAPVFLDDLRVSVSDLESVVFTGSLDNVSQKPDGAFRVATTSGDVFTADLIGADNKTLTMANRRFGMFTVARTAVYSISRCSNPNVIFDGSRLESCGIDFAPIKGLKNKPLAIEDSATLWQLASGGHAMTDRTGSSLFRKVDLPERFELDVELAASAAPKFVLAIAKDERAAAANQTLRL